MNELLKRLDDERYELSEKIERLGNFLRDKYNVVSEKQISLLREQYTLMINYHHILCERIIDLLESKNSKDVFEQRCKIGK